VRPARSSPLAAGTVGRPHGLDGSFHVRRARPELLRPGAVLSVAGRAARVARLAGSDARPVLRLEGVTDRATAQALHGQPLLVAHQDAPLLEPGEWWAEELVGCRVTDGSRAVGVVRRLVALPSCEALEVERPEGGELLVPMVADAVRAVDVEARRIDVRLAFLEPGDGR
jgi:16S rRNA processing protein RimM